MSVASNRAECGEPPSYTPPKGSPKARHRGAWGRGVCVRSTAERTPKRRPEACAGLWWSPATRIGGDAALPGLTPPPPSPHTSQHLLVWRKVISKRTTGKHTHRVGRSPAHLHPKEEALGPCLELEHVDPPAGALRHPLELTVIGKDDQVLVTQGGTVSQPLHTPPRFTRPPPPPRGKPAGPESNRVGVHKAQARRESPGGAGPHGGVERPWGPDDFLNSSDRAPRGRRSTKCNKEQCSL